MRVAMARVDVARGEGGRGGEVAVRVAAGDKVFGAAILKDGSLLTRTRCTLLRHEERVQHA